MIPVLASLLCLAQIPFLEWLKPAPSAREAPRLEFVTTEGETRLLSGFHGHWVLLVVGHAHCRRTSNTVRVLHRLIEDFPPSSRVALVELLNEPTILDAELFSHLPARWIRAVPAPGASMAFYWRERIPGWFLIDPEGLLRDFGHRLPAEKLRLRVLDALDEPGAGLPRLGDDEKLLDRGADELCSRNFQQAARTLSTYLEKHPHDEFAMRLLFSARSWVEGKVPKILDDLESRFGEDHPPSSRLQLHFDVYRCFYGGGSGDRKRIRDWAARHPESRFLEAIRLSITKLPEDITTQEELTMLGATDYGMFFDLSTYLGYVCLAKGAPKRAWEFFEFIKGNDRLGALPRMLVLRDMGAPDAAWELTGYTTDFDLSTAGRADVWRFMHASAVLDRWDQVAAAARRYREQRPEWAQGFLMSWLAAVILGDEEGASQARGRALEIIREKDRYAKYRSMLEDGLPEDPDDVKGIVDHNVRWDMVLAAALLEHERGGWEGLREVFKRAQPGMDLKNFYGLAHHLRTRAESGPAHGP
jgi:hypothetical protein